MRKSLAALLLLFGVTAFTANVVLADVETGGDFLSKKAVSSQISRELDARGGSLGTSSGPLGGATAANDTLWVGYSPHSTVDARNFWRIYAGFGGATDKTWKRPINGAPGDGLWSWDAPVNGDSLQGWWPRRRNESAAINGSPDWKRPWTQLDFGNVANYVINESRGANWQNAANGLQPGWRTFGVDGVWHIDDAGAPVAAPVDVGVAANPVPGPTWTPLGGAGTKSAWMGLRAHNDVRFQDPLTKNYFNEDVLAFNLQQALASSGNDKKFPGYGSQMDQMLYRDIDFTGKSSAALTVSFLYRTNMSTNALQTNRWGWFDKDPLQVVGGTTQNPATFNNFISGTQTSTAVGVANAPRDSFMVYVGTGVDGNQWIGSDGALHDVYDKKHRWFAEVLHADLGGPCDGAAGPIFCPQPSLYKELLSVAGDHIENSAVPISFTLTNPQLSPYLAKSNKIRLVFRVKTNRNFDDERNGGGTYSSGGAGAAVVDKVTYTLTGNSPVVFGDFENLTDINNDPNVSAVAAWKSTGKPCAIYDHIEQLGNLPYLDICGQKGDITRICNIAHGIISPGDHENGEQLGSPILNQAETDLRTSIISPTIVFANDNNGVNNKNTQGILPYDFGGLGNRAGDAFASSEYYIHYDLYAGVYDGNNGNFWQFGTATFPGASAAATPVYNAWGQLREPGFIFYQPIGRICFTDNVGFRQYGLMRTSKPGGVPDSLRIYLTHLQLCYALGASAGCAPTDGAYWDNVSLAIVDGLPAQLSVDIWQYLQDAFPANETASFAGNKALFDTTSALVKTGLNVFPRTSRSDRYNIPGDSTAVNVATTVKRVDMIFRVLPGPGNYQPIGEGHNGNLRKLPSSPSTVASGDNSWWDVMRRIPGHYASANAVALMLPPNVKSGWNSDVWLSARCDTTDTILYPVQSRSIQPPPATNSYQSTWHESDKRFNLLGITKNQCFLTDPNAPATQPNVDCSGVLPPWVPPGTASTTKENTKIIPDGLLTAGSHVEYFFRASDADGDVGAAMVGMCPDTNTVFPQTTSGPDFDGHRWESFNVLPDRWKDTQYRHPVFQTFGRGPACLLVVDWQKRGGDELPWNAVADTIGANESAKIGASTGYGNVPGLGANQDVNLPQYRIARNLGQRGTTYDQWRINASESSDAATGTLGARLSYKGGVDPLVIAKTNRIGPTPEELDAYYTLMLILSGSINFDMFGPYSNASTRDVDMIQGWLNHGNTSVQNRGIWAVGDGFVEANTLNAENAQSVTLMNSSFGVDLVDRNFQQFANVADATVDLRVFPEWQGKGVAEIYGMRNVCTWTNDVLTFGRNDLVAYTSEYEKKNAPVGGYYAGVFKDWDPTSPWKALVDGWDLFHLTSRFDPNTVGRSTYFYKIFTNVWAKIWLVPGTPVVQLDVPSLDDGSSFVNFVNAQNPTTGSANIFFSLSKPDRVQIDVYDVGGRLVRKVVDHQFDAGKHTIVWDGLDNAGRLVPRGVFFTQVRYQNLKFKADKKIIVLR